MAELLAQVFWQESVPRVKLKINQASVLETAFR